MNTVLPISYLRLTIVWPSLGPERWDGHEATNIKVIMSLMCMQQDGACVCVFIYFPTSVPLYVSVVSVSLVFCLHTVITALGWKMTRFFLRTEGLISMYNASFHPRSSLCTIMLKALNLLNSAIEPDTCNYVIKRARAERGSCHMTVGPLTCRDFGCTHTRICRLL